MIAVIFEVVPTKGQRDRYLQITAELKPLLQQIDGSISIERFQSQSFEAQRCPCHFGAKRRPRPARLAHPQRPINADHFAVQISVLDDKLGQ